MRSFAWVAATILVLSSAVGPVAAIGGQVAEPQVTESQAIESEATGSTDSAAPPDPSRDVLGWENGYWHNESISVDQSDGLSDAEMKRFVARSMARVEYLRRNEFKQSVPVEVISRADYRNRSSGGNQTGPYAAWNNQVWEALFLVGEETNVQAELQSTLGSSVAGFYSPGDDEIKIITDTPDEPTIDNATLIHELTHALQDQHYNLSQPKYHGDTQDTQLATDGLVEGEANYIERRYSQRCRGEWSCVATPKSGGGGSGSSDIHLGILLVLIQPYSDGPAYVHTLHQRGGWSAFDRAFEHPPNTTEQIIHTTEEKPEPIDYRDRARNGWQLFDQGQNGSDTAGEASMFVMFWYQAREYGANTIDPQVLGRTSGEYDQYNYDAAPSAGWANDRVFPYHKNTSNGTEYGYVWVTEWDTRQDAREFRNTYLHILKAHDATRQNGVYVVEDGPFADTFRVTQRGDRVVIVNGPTPADVRDIRPSQTQGSTPTSAPLTVETATRDSSVPTELFGLGLKALAIVAALLVLGLVLFFVLVVLVALVLLLRRD